ncbi:hypothetical protein [Thalassotalea euphylliae]|uniref:hypothetical protein n=1 Tax=Thalassotalea euphylliae TaxID=1655234 RepID=UPI0036DB3A0B
MSRVKSKVLFDVVVATTFILLTTIYLVSHRTDKYVVDIDLTDSELSCKLNSRRENYTGYYHLNGERYFSSNNFSSCDEFKVLMSGKKIIGKYLKSNNLLVELRVGKSLYSENSIGMQILQGIFFGFVFFVILRKPIHWLRSKVV